ncbi:MAG: DeoR/GlpR family DNA-binding transcription regulator [Treponema sp.]|jgi:DeoR/GlpR family transcriptional regulator of sugar metabolism|nr:DeoR/GlpR family DNA-binding transcription regulator [Treponema sp.]
MNDRVVRILEILSANKKVKTKLLAEMLDASFVTVRKDLDLLENRGIVCRIHGYVGLDGANDTGKRIAVNYSIKSRIAKTAAQIVEEGELVILESGSCCAMLAEELALAKKNINIVTNSVFIANYVCKLQNLKITLLGGHLQPGSEVLVGPMTKKCAELVYSHKMFLGTDGFIPEYGFTGRDHLRIETAVELAARAKEVYVLTEASKFKSRGSYNLIQFEKLTGVFTDDGIPKEAEAVLTNNKVRIHKVPASIERIKWRLKK